MTITIHPINYVDDMIDATIKLPGAIREYMRTDHETIGQRIKATVRITAAGVVLAVLIALDIAKLMYQAGYALGQSVHKLNHDLTLFLCGWGFGLPPIQPLAPQVNPWQLQLPIVTSALQRYVSGSTSTTGDSSIPTHQPSSMSIQPTCVTAAPKKAVGGTKSENQSKVSASSARSKQSVQPSNSTSGHSKSSARRTTSTATRRTVSSTKTSTGSTTRKSVRITSDKTEA